MYCMWTPSSSGQRGKPDTFSKLRGPSRIFTGLHALAATHNHKNDAFLRRARRARCCEHQNRAQGLQCRCTGQCGDPRFCERWRFELHAVGATLPGDGATARRPAAAVRASKKRRDPRRPLSAQVLGAAGGIGQPLSLLLKADPLVSGLSLYDVVNTPGVAADLSHCNTPATVTGVTGVGNAEEALKGADVVVIPAGS